MQATSRLGIMAAMKVLCFDLSASSGRFIVVSYDKGQILAEETHRFSNHPYEKDGHLYWDIRAIEEQMLCGIKFSFHSHPDIQSVGIDTFGVDYVRLGKGSSLLSDPFAYRDTRNVAAREKATSKVPYSEIYQTTGIQSLPFNTLFQFYDDKIQGYPAEEVLFLPDYLNYLLTGVKATERTIASTGALLDLNRELALPLLERLGLNPSLLPPLKDPLTRLGTLRHDIASSLGVPEVPIILTASHDTASAVASIDLDEDTLYLSSGTWSLLGAETSAPIVTPAAEEANFTNELGLNGSNRFLKNIMGLFILQELYNAWQALCPSLTFSRLALEASQSPTLPFFIDVDDPLFSTPMDMEKKFYQYLKKTKQESGKLTRGEIARIVYESMAFAYKRQYETFASLHGKPYGRLVVVGGGSKAELLNQFIADALSLTVQTGQAEATVYGNALAQFLALDKSLSWEQLRHAMIPEDRRVYTPKNDLSSRYLRYQEIIHRRK